METGEQAGRLGRLARWPLTPALVLLLVAPYVGEVLSTSTPPLVLLLPWKLVLLAALYGSGALICREVARRYHLGLPGLCLLAAAYAVLEEALVVHSWFDTAYQRDVGLGSYSRVWHTNLVLAAHLTVFHVAVSICSSIVVVERLFPAHRDRPWAGPRGLILAGLALVVVVPLGYGRLGQGPLGPQLAAGGLIALLVGAAFLLPRRSSGHGAQRERTTTRFVGTVAFVGTAAQFVLTYALPSTDVPWPLGLALSLAPVVGGVLLVRRLARRTNGPDALQVVTGILAFFVVLDALVGLGGRYDLTVSAFATAYALWWLDRRGRRRPPPYLLSLASVPR